MSNKAKNVREKMELVRRYFADDFIKGGLSTSEVATIEDDRLEIAKRVVSPMAETVKVALEEFYEEDCDCAGCDAINEIADIHGGQKPVSPGPG